MEFEWVNKEPGVLVLNGTPFSVRLLNGSEYQPYRGEKKLGPAYDTLYIAKVACENDAKDLHEIGAL